MGYDNPLMTPRKEKAIERAMRRRFGASILPYSIKTYRGAVVRCTDLENGASIDVDISYARILVIGLREATL